MKKLLLLIVGAFMLSTNVPAQVLVPLTVCITENEQPGGPGHPRSPIEVPLVYIEDYTLSFEANHPDYVLIIKDEDGSVVYNTMVFSAQTEVFLPSTLSGDYEIDLVMGNWLFIGRIEL